MRIVAINTLYPPSKVGGAERSLAVLAEALVTAGHEVHVVCLAEGRRRGSSAPEIRGGVHVHRVSPGNLYFAWDGRKRNAVTRLMWHLLDRGRAANQSAVEALLDRVRPDVVHTNNLTGFGAGLIPAIRERSIPVVHTLRDFSLMCSRATLFRNGEDCNPRCVECRFLTAPRMAATQGVAQVVGNSEFMIERHRDHGLFTDVPCRTIFNAVPGIEKWPPARPEPKRGEPIRFGFMGMIKPEKGIELLLGSLDALPRRDWKLAIAGVGGEDYCSALQARFAHLPVEWLGFVRTEQFYPMIDTLVIPSIWPEPMPRTLIEAAAARVPAIVSDAGGSAEVAAMFPSARVYSSQDVAALTAELDAACSAGPIAFNPPAPEVLETFTPARLAANYEEVFREALQERAQP